MARIKFTADAVYQSGDCPSFKAGQIVDAADLKAVLRLSEAPPEEFARSWLNRWVQRGVAEWHEGPATVRVMDMEPAPIAVEPPAEAPRRRGRPPKGF